jgi:hypothetical protein
MSTDLETRLQSMGGALRESVADVPDRALRRPGPGRIAIGVPIVAIAALATLFVVRDDAVPAGDTDPVASLHGLVVADGALPDGMALSWAGRQDAGVDTGVTDGVVDAGVGAAGDVEAGPIRLHTSLYGDARAALPFAGTDLVVNVWQSPAEAPAFDPGAVVQATAGATQVTVQGQGAVACDRSSCAATAQAGAGAAGVSSLRWEATGGVEVLLASRSLDVEQLRPVAEGLRVSATDAALGALPADLAGRLALVARLDDEVVGGARQVAAHWVGYTDVASSARAVDITTLAGGADELAALVWGLGDARQVDLRGGKGFLAVGADGAVELVWQEEEGVLVRVSAVGLSTDEVLATAKGLHRAAAKEWKQVEEQAATAVEAIKGELERRAAEAAAALEASGGAGTTPGSGSGSVQAEGSATDLGAQVDSALGQLEAQVHANPGAEAVLGPVVDAAEQGKDALEGAGEQLTSPLTTPTTPSTRPLLP